MTDFNIVLDASDFGRIQSVTVLNELYMRMAQSAPIPRQLPDMQRVHTLDPYAGNKMPWDAPNHDLPVHSTLPYTQASQKSPKTLSSSPDDSVYLRGSNISSGSMGRKWNLPFGKRSPRKSSLTPEINMMSLDSTNELATSKSQSGRVPENLESAAWDNPPQASNKRQSSHEAQIEWQPSPQMRIEEDNPWREETSATALPGLVVGPQDKRDRGESYSGPRRISTGQTLFGDDRIFNGQDGMAQPGSHFVSHTRLDSNPTTSISRESTSSDLKSTPSKFYSMFRSRTTSGDHVTEKPPLARTDNSRKFSPAVTRKNSAPNDLVTETASPRSKDPYGGFCKGAYKLQVGLVGESMKICNQSTSGTGQSFYWTCASSKCCFEGPACKVGKSWEFDNTVRATEGVRYRWTLLAKSHVAMSKVKNHMYEYRCVFCAEQGQPTSIHYGDRAFLDHITIHRNQPYSALSSEKVVCVKGTVAVDHQVFDVNFPPIMESNHSHERTLVNSPEMEIRNSEHNTSSPEEEEGLIWCTPIPSSDRSPWEQQS